MNKNVLLLLTVVMPLSLHGSSQHRHEEKQVSVAQLLPDKAWGIIREYLGHEEYAKLENNTRFSIAARFETDKEQRAFNSLALCGRYLAAVNSAKSISSGEDMNVISLVDLVSKNIREITIDHFRSMTFSTDGECLSVVTTLPYGRGIRTIVLNSQTGEVIRACTLSNQLWFSCVAGLDNKTIACANLDDLIAFFDGTTGKQTHAFTPHDDIISTIEFDPHSTMLGVGYLDGTVILLDCATGTTQKYNSHSTIVRSFVFSRNKFVTSSNRTIYIHNRQKRNAFNALLLGGIPQKIALSPDDHYLGLIDDRGETVELYNTQTKQLLKKIGNWSQRPTAIAFDSKFPATLAVATRTKNISIELYQEQSLVPRLKQQEFSDFKKIE